MTESILLLIFGAYTLFGSYVNRWRGGGDQIRGSTPRALSYLYFSIPFWFLGVTEGLVAFVLIYFPGFAKGWGKYFDMTPRYQDETEVGWIDWLVPKLLGGIPKEDNPKWLYHDIIGMSLRGLHFTVPLAILGGILYSPMIFLFIPAGLLMGPLYYYGKYFDDPDVWWKSDKLEVFKLDGHTSLGEVFWGLVLGAIYSGMVYYALYMV